MATSFDRTFDQHTHISGRVSAASPEKVVQALLAQVFVNAICCSMALIQHQHMRQEFPSRLQKLGLVHSSIIESANAGLCRISCLNLSISLDHTAGASAVEAETDPVMCRLRVRLIYDGSCHIQNGLLKSKRSKKCRSILLTLSALKDSWLQSARTH